MPGRYCVCVCLCVISSTSRCPPNTCSFGGMYYQGTVSDGFNRYGLFLNVCVSRAKASSSFDLSSSKPLQTHLHPLFQMQLAFANVSEMSGAVDGKYIGYRHVDNGLHPAWTFPFAAIVCHIPIALAEAFIFGFITYFMSGLAVEVGRFFYFTLIIFLVDVFSATLFRSVSRRSLASTDHPPQYLYRPMPLLLTELLRSQPLPWWLHR